MKLERMLSIITYLLNHDKVKSQELADKFEVSVRTIYRDIDAISQAGIPIIAYQGADGGIGIMEGYKLDKSILTGDEVLKIVAGLKGLQSINEDIKINLLIDKLKKIADKSEYVPAGSEIMIDLSPWNKNDKLGLRIEKIRKAIIQRNIIEFTYYKNGKLIERRAEPCVIVFKQSNWYLYAFCLLRHKFRLFKLRRMDSLNVRSDTFPKRDFSVEDISFDGEPVPAEESAVVLFDKSMLHAVNDIFGMDNYEVMEDGRLKVSLAMEMGGWLYGFILSFGDKVEVIEPVELRDKIKDIAKGILDIYKERVL